MFMNLCFDKLLNGLDSIRLSSIDIGGSIEGRPHALALTQYMGYTHEIAQLVCCFLEAWGQTKPARYSTKCPKEMVEYVLMGAKCLIKVLEENREGRSCEGN